MRNRVPLIFCALVLVLAGCRKQDPETSHLAPVQDDAAYLLDGLVKEVSGEYVPLQGFLSEGGLVIPCTSIFEAERHFRSLLPPDASPREGQSTLIWSMSDEKGAPQGEAVFSLENEPLFASVSLPASFPAEFKAILYKPLVGLLGAVNPDVQEDLEDNYFYGAIVNISDHGCGSGKFVVLREYNFSNGAAGMAIRLDSRRWHQSEMKQGSTEHDIASRASCLATMRTAGEIIRADWNVITKQLLNAGSRMPDQHFYSADRQWTGLPYYYCLHDGECDTIGPFHDLEFYECWIYWFVPDGNSLRFW